MINTQRKQILEHLLIRDTPSMLSTGQSKDNLGSYCNAQNSWVMVTKTALKAVCV